ncbi:MAG: glycosyltransferase family 2 protein [Oscillospiraceae bacterium]|nr:glycosyltransferase family 2 protein [Oscillospiraceae bacterium]
MPVYNAQHCLKKSVESVIRQTHTDFELIIVESCSQDNSAAMCDEFARSDSRIKVFHEDKARGPASARNMAIDKACGDYIMFIDCDDCIEQNMLASMLSEIEAAGCDIVISGYYQDFLDSDDLFLYSVEVDPPVIFADNHRDCVAAVPFLDAAKVLAVSWNKIYKADVIKNNGVKFADLMHSEDYFFIIDLFKYVNSLKTVQDKYYHYMKYQRTSLTNKPYLQGFTEIINNRFFAQRELLKSAGVYGGKPRELMCAVHIKHVFSAIVNECGTESGITSAERRERVKSLLNHINTVEAKRYTADISKMQTVMNALVKSGSPFAAEVAGRLIWLIQHKAPALFNKMKIK